MKWRLDPDEIFLDSTNLPSLDNQQFEGRLERPITKRVFFWFGWCFLLIFAAFLFKVGYLQLWRGPSLAARAENNILRHLPIFAERGLILDRFGSELAWNDPDRRYTTQPGFGHLLGYITYPTPEELTTKAYLPQELIGREGVERAFNDYLHGTRGVKIEEVDVTGTLQSDYLVESPVEGESLNLSVDARLQTKLFTTINELVTERALFRAGAGAIMDIYTGELLAVTSVPEYDPNVLSQGRAELIKPYLADPRFPFLNRVATGLYTPGSTVKPFFALGALEEAVIDPEKEILSTGSISIPNPYFPDQPSVFRDWKAHGLTDMRHAIAVSSDVYFYTIGGGYGGQRGLGIEKLEQYARRFGFGRPTGLTVWPEEPGTVPTPKWKAEKFNGEPWRLGDTYNTVIGQYGFQVTPLQLLRAVAAIANGGQLVTPTVAAIDSDRPPVVELIRGISPESFKVVREGMRLGVTEGTAKGLDTSAVALAAKTGTAELGAAKQYVNSWVTGFFPYEAPRYAFVVLMERGDRTNLIGATYVMRQVIDWLAATAPEYFVQ